MESMRDRFTNVSTELLDTNPRVALVLADIGVSRFRDTGAIERHPERVVNVGIREQAMIGVAAGLAHEGFRPVVHSYAPFLVERPFEQIKLDLGHQDLGAVLVSIGASYDTAGEGRTHQAPEDVALLATLPGWEIHVPGHPDEVDALLTRAACQHGRVYLRLAEDANREARPVGDGKIVAVRRGDRGVVVAVGPMLDRVIEATRDMDVTVLYTATVRPFDTAGVLEHAGDLPVAIVEPLLQGTTAAELAAGLGDRPLRVVSVGVPRTEHRHYGTRHEHDTAHGLDVRGIRERIARLVS